MEHALLDSVLEAWPREQWRDTPVLVGVSGGPDSMALLDCLYRLGDPGQIHVGHFNHGWRGIESDSDCRFVAEHCAQARIPCHTEAAPVTSARRDESHARELRYRFLGTMAEQIGARYLAIAHTRDDQVETITHRLLRGTGLRGLAGMAARRTYSRAVTIVRPLLQSPRTRVLDYLRIYQVPYRCDASNLDVAYTRNQIRHVLLPLLADRFNAKIDAALLRLAGQAGEIQAWIARYADTWLAPCLTSIDDCRFEIDLSRAAPVPEQGVAILLGESLRSQWRQRHWPLQRTTAEHWTRLTAWLLHGRDPSRFELPGGVHIERSGPGRYVFFRAIPRRKKGGGQDHQQ